MTTAELLEKRLAPLAKARGRGVGEVLEWLADALEQLPPRRDEPGREWTEPELAVLRGEGLDPDEPADQDVAAISARAYLRLLADSLDTAEAAERLGISASRVRQRASARQLYGLHVGGGWRFPAWQFGDRDIVPGLDRVLPHLSKTLHPLSVTGFFSTPQPELVIRDQAVSPLRWLATGGDPGPVAELAAALGAGG